MRDFLNNEKKFFFDFVQKTKILPAIIISLSMWFPLFYPYYWQWGTHANLLFSEHVKYEEDVNMANRINFN